MVKIVDYKSFEKEDGTLFHSLVVQGGIESVRSAETGKSYLTARKATVPSTFDEETCKSLIGVEMEGSIRKVKVEPYDYTIKSSGEVISLDYSYEYFDGIETVIKDNVVEEEEMVL